MHELLIRECLRCRIQAVLPHDLHLKPLEVTCFPPPPPCCLQMDRSYILCRLCSGSADMSSRSLTFVSLTPTRQVPWPASFLTLASTALYRSSSGWFESCFCKRFIQPTDAPFLSGDTFIRQFRVSALSILSCLILSSSLALVVICIFLTRTVAEKPMIYGPVFFAGLQQLLGSCAIVCIGSQMEGCPPSIGLLLMQLLSLAAITFSISLLKQPGN